MSNFASVDAGAKIALATSTDERHCPESTIDG